MKKIVLTFIVILALSTTAFAHSGGTDRCGGHNNRKTGGYHVHNWSKYRACNPQKSEQKKEEPKKQNSDDTIRERIINESISSYPGNCPCPYNRASNGSRCGKRSAYSRPGGYEPLCYKSDVTDEMVRKYRNTQDQ